MVCECGSNEVIRNADGFLVCGGCGLVLGEDNITDDFEMNNSNNERKRNALTFIPSATFTHSSRQKLGSIISLRDDLDGKFRKLIRINTSTITDEYRRHLHEEKYYKGIEKICEVAQLGERIKRESKNLIKTILKNDQEYLKSKSILLFCGAVVYRVAKRFKPDLNEKQILNIILNKNGGIIDPKILGLSDDYIIPNADAYTRLLHDPDAKREYMRIRTRGGVHAFHKYFYEIAKYDDKFDPKIAIKHLVFDKKITFDDGEDLPASDFGDIISIAERIFEVTKTYGAPNSSKAVLSVYFAVMLKYDKIPSADYFPKLSSGSIRTMASHLNIVPITRSNRNMLKMKYILYPKNFRKSYYIISPSPLNKILPEVTYGVTPSPRGFKTELGNYYEGINNNKILAIVNGEKKIYKIHDFVDKIADIIGGRITDIHVYTFLCETGVINITFGEIEKKLSNMWINATLNFILNTSRVKYVPSMETKEEKECNLKMRGIVNIGDAEVIVRMNKFNKPIIAVKKRNIKTEKMYSLSDFETILKIISELNEFGYDDLRDFDKNLVTLTIKLLSKFGIIQKKRNGKFVCGKGFDEVSKKVDQSFVSASLQYILPFLTDVRNNPTE